MAWPADIGTVDVYRGDALSVPITVRDSLGVLVNLTAYGSSWSAMARHGQDNTTVVSFAVDATAAATGVIKLTLTGVQTGALSLGTSYGFDVQVTGGPLDPLTLFKGSLRVDGDYTHA